MKLSYQGTNHFYFAPTKKSDLRPFIELGPKRKRLIKLQNIKYVNNHLSVLEVQIQARYFEL